MYENVKMCENYLDNIFFGVMFANNINKGVRKM